MAGKWIWALLGTSATLAFSLFLFAQNQPSQPVQGEGKDLPEGDGKKIVATVCKTCHGLEAITAANRSAEDWNRVVNEMVSDGAPLKDEEVAIVTEYLAKNFGLARAPQSPSANSAGDPAKEKVPINKDTAKQLQKALGLSEEEANAIVTYREKYGNFANWEELEKVPSFDSKKIEPAKDRLEF